MRERIVGRIPVLECLRARKRPSHKLWVLEGARDINDVLAAAGRLPVQTCARRDLDTLSGGVLHQGVVLEVSPLPILNADDWSSGPFPEDAVVVILDGVEDPHNFGAIVRSAAACGAHAVLFGKHRSAPISPVSAKSAAGAMEYIDLVCATNLVRAMGALKDAGFWIAGLDAEGMQTIWDADLAGRVALVIGSEGQGMRRLTLENCDWTMRIPLQGAITSLNASVSAAIALAECVRRRQPTGKNA